MKKPRAVERAVRVAPYNCLNPHEGLPGYPDDYFDATITDPPYEKHTHDKKWTGGNKQKGAGVKKVTFAPMTDAERIAVAYEIVRTTRGWAVVFCEDQAIARWRDALTEAGAMRWAGCIWTKPNATPQFRGEGPSQPCEHIVTAWCGEGRPRWNGGGKPGHYVYNTSPKKGRRHETEKPLPLMQSLLLDFSNPGGIVSDPYTGGGQTGVAARTCGREFKGWEIDHEMAAVADKAIRNSYEQMNLESVFRARAGAFGEAGIREKQLQGNLF